MYAAKVKASVNPKPAKAVSSTPISKGDKREATSPLDTADFDSKKIRHHSEESISLLEGVVLGAHAIEENVENVENVAVEPESVHFLSQPIVPSDIVGIASELRSLMLPEISKLFKEQLPHIQTIVNTVVSEATGALKDEIQYLRDENASLQSENESLRERISKVESDNESLEQYTRRNSVRISGIPEELSENTDDIVLKLADKLDVPMTSADIDRSHRVGKPDNRGRTAATSKTRHRDIIVKFATYNARHRLYSMRKELRTTDMNRVFINEDLTRYRSKLLFDARSLVRCNKLKSAYSSDGKIFIRDHNDHCSVVRCDIDLHPFEDIVNTRGVPARRPLTRGFSAYPGPRHQSH